MNLLLRTQASKMIYGMTISYLKNLVKAVVLLAAAFLVFVFVAAPVKAGLLPSVTASGGEQVGVQYLSNAPRSLALGGPPPSWEPLRAETVLSQPGSLGFVDRNGIFVSQMNLFEDASFRAAGLVLPLRSHITLGAGLYQLTSGNADARDVNGVITGNFKNQETLMRLSCGRPIYSGLAIGGNFDYIKMSLADSSHGFASFGLGGSWRPRGSDLNIDLTAVNLATKVLGDTADTLSMGLKAGVSYGIIHDVAAIYFGTEFNPGFGYEAGVDWALGRLLSLHLGRKNDINGMGLGVNIGKNYHFGYTFSMHELGMINQLTLSITLGRGQTAKWKKDTEILYSKADKAVEDGKYEEALSLLRRSEAFMPLPADRELVKTQLKKVLAGGVDDISGTDKNLYLLRRGVQFYTVGNEDMARTAFQSVLANVPTHSAARRLIALLPVLNTQGITMQQNADFSGSDPVRIKLYQIQRYYTQKEYDRALKECQELLVLNPREVMALVQMGSIYWTMGLKKEAEAAWKKAETIEPNNPEVKKSIDFLRQEK